MQRLLALAVLSLSLLMSPAAFADCITGDALFSHPELKTSESSYQSYSFRFYGDKSCEAEPETHIAGLEILKGDKRVYTLTGYSFSLGYALDHDQSPDSLPVPPGTDMTGEGIPDLLISEWSGGAHCCYIFHLFRLGAGFKKIQAIPVLDADESGFVKRPGIPGLVLVTADYSAFAYFPKSFAGSPAGRVFLSFQEGRFRLNPALMKADGPDKAQIEKCAENFRKSRAWKDGQAMGMWYYATDLIYTGNEGAALKFLDESWGGSAADRDKYLKEYQRRLQKSVYYPELKLLQQLGPSPGNQKVDWTKQCSAYLEG